MMTSFFGKLGPGRTCEMSAITIIGTTETDYSKYVKPDFSNYQPRPCVLKQEVSKKEARKRIQPGFRDPGYLRSGLSSKILENWNYQKILNNIRNFPKKLNPTYSSNI